MKTLILVLMVFMTTGTFGDYAKFIEKWEGRKHTVYTCPAGYKTIGVGHLIKKGESFTYLSDTEIDHILSQDIETAITIARKTFKNFDQHPYEVRLIMCDLAYNLGENKLALFKKTIKAFDLFDYKTASLELKNSKWFRQTGLRAKHHVDFLAKLW